jgi:hypothetical protein
MSGMKIKKRYVFAIVFGCLLMCKRFRQGLREDLQEIFKEEK